MCFLSSTGKTYTAMADGCITEFAIEELFDLIKLDVLHEYKVRNDKRFMLFSSCKERH